MPKEYFNPRELFPSQQYGFSQVIATDGKRTVYLSGQVAWNAQQEMEHPLDLGAQARRALENLETGVKAAGGTRADVVSMRIYVVGEHIHNTVPVREALLEFFPRDQLPTSTWIGVSALANKDFLIEIEAIAVLQ
ncbi:MAG TPA: RidA family protein [Candidatus Angelobacter sp.]|nr:RidA family protein [Candidatus Angelobacter sp.]